MKYPVSAQRFREVLAERNMQAQELAARSGLSKAAISQYVNGSRCPTNRTALRYITSEPALADGII